MKKLLLAIALTCTAAGCMTETQVTSTTLPQPDGTAPTVVVVETAHPVVAAVEDAAVRTTVWTVLDVIFHTHGRR